MGSLWLRDAPAVPSSSLPERAEVAIVGGGIAGVASALHLARAGIDVVLLERRTIAAGASGRNDGQLLLGLGEHYNRIHGQFGADRAPVLWDFLQQNHDALLAELQRAGIACDLRREGGLRLAETPHEWRELQQASTLLAAEGRPHELLDADEVRRRIPGSAGFHGGLFLADEAIVQPARMVRGLATLAVRNGARLVTGTEVARIDGDAGAFALTLGSGQRLGADVVVHCTAALGRDLDQSGLLQRTLFPFRGQIVASDPLPAALARTFPAWAMSSNFCYEYFRLHRGRFVIGGKRWSVPGEQLDVVDDTSHDERISANLIAYAHEHFPALREIDFPDVWTGIMAGTPDGLPLCGALPGTPGAFALLGFNGYGLGFAFLAGKAIADMIADGAPGHPALPMFAPRRFRDG
ncbi:MAG TPA: FAD-binding oxidoreductase [bacterium]|nr:FAD-binding oxidoreductase [bacterium]